MPRIPRVVLPGYPHHVTHQGHNTQPVFVEESDYRFYLESLAEWKNRLSCKVHTYCLMTNHVHIVVNPGPEAANLGLLMKHVAGDYTRHVNRAEGRTGTVWNGRYRSSPIDTDLYLMACMRYVELNPVRARIVAHPRDYPWSSYNARVGRSICDWLDDDPCFEGIGTSQRERSEAYREFVADGIPQGEWSLIRESIRLGRPTGNSRFRAIVERRLNRRAPR